VPAVSAALFSNARRVSMDGVFSLSDIVLLRLRCRASLDSTSWRASLRCRVISKLKHPYNQSSWNVGRRGTRHAGSRAGRPAQQSRGTSRPLTTIEFRCVLWDATKRPSWTEENWIRAGKPVCDAPVLFFPGRTGTVDEVASSTQRPATRTKKGHQHICGLRHRARGKSRSPKAPARNVTAVSGGTVRWSSARRATGQWRGWRSLTPLGMRRWRATRKNSLPQGVWANVECSQRLGCSRIPTLASNVLAKEIETASLRDSNGRFRQPGHEPFSPSRLLHVIRIQERPLPGRIPGSCAIEASAICGKFGILPRSVGTGSDLDADHAQRGCGTTKRFAEGTVVPRAPRTQRFDRYGRRLVRSAPPEW